MPRVDSTLFSEICCDCLLTNRNDENSFLVGCYELLNSTIPNESAKRIGSISAISVSSTSELNVDWLQKVDYGVLDCKYLNDDVFITSNSNGSLSFFTESAMKNYLLLSSNGSVQMSLDCSKKQTIVTCNDLGYVHLLDQNLNERCSFKAHQAECWTVLFYGESGNVFLTGSDDGSIRMWDERVGFKENVLKVDFHEYGVCNLSSNPYNRSQVVSGSYDNSMAIWDFRNVPSLNENASLSVVKTTPIQHIRLPGGVWRTNWHPQNENLVLASCMYEGSVIVNIKEQELCRFDFPNSSISYGGIFIGKNQIATCSFYDKKVTLWNTDQ